MELAPNAYYTEDQLVAGLGCSRAWLRRRVAHDERYYERPRMYLGSNVVAAMRPAGTRRISGPSIYFIRCCDAIKIGFASDVKLRFDGLQTANPHPLELLTTYPGSLADEAALHEKFAHLRVRGEWFRADAELLDFIGRGR